MNNWESLFYILGCFYLTYQISGIIMKESASFLLGFKRVRKKFEEFQDIKKRQK